MLDHWQLRTNPFAANAGDGEFALVGRCEEALSRLEFLIEQGRRLGVVTGPPGVGKSHLLRETARHVERTNAVIITIDATGLSRDEFAAQLASRIGAVSSPVRSPWDQIEDALHGWRVISAASLWIIDQADDAAENLDLAVLRLIHQLESTRAAGTVLIAARSLPKRSALSEAIDLAIALEPWPTADCGEFIRSRLRSAGSHRPIFTEDALEAIAEASANRPNSLIRMCDVALNAGWTLGATEIDAGLVAGLVDELASDGDRRVQFSERGA